MYALLLPVLFLPELSRCILKSRQIKKYVYQMILVLIFISSSNIYVLSADSRMIYSFTCLNYRHFVFSFHLPSHCSLEKSKENKMLINYKMPATEVLNNWYRIFHEQTFQIQRINFSAYREQDFIYIYTANTTFCIPQKHQFEGKTQTGGEKGKENWKNEANNQSNTLIYMYYTVHIFYCIF